MPLAAACSWSPQLHSQGTCYTQLTGVGGGVGGGYEGALLGQDHGRDKGSL